VAGSCEHGNEVSGSIHGEKFLDLLSGCQLQEGFSIIQAVKETTSFHSMG
jgi:hypothetical protein